MSVKSVALFYSEKGEIIFILL